MPETNVERCTECNEPFERNDDFIVCPDCRIAALKVVVAAVQQRERDRKQTLKARAS